MKRINRFKQNALALSITSVLALSAAAQLQAEEAAKFQINIASKNIGQAVRELAKSANVQIVMPSELGNAYQAPSLNGEYSLDQALQLLMEGSGLKYEFLSDQSIVIKEHDEQPTESDDEVEEEVVVVGVRNVVRNRTKSVEPTLVYEGSYFERFEPLTLSDMLKRVPGVFFDRLFNLPDRSNGASATEPAGNLPRFRNLSSEYSQILVNGRQLASIDFGGGSGESFLATIPAESVQSIQVIRSPSATMDSSGVGLTLNVILKDGTKYQSNSWRTGAASYDGNVNGVGSINLSGSGDTFDYNLGLTYQERESGGVSVENTSIAFASATTLYLIEVASQQLETDKNLIGSVGFDVGESGRLRFEGQYFQTDTDGATQVDLRYSVVGESTETYSEQFSETQDDNTNAGLTAIYQYQGGNFSWESVFGWNQSKQDSFGLNVRDSQPGGIFFTTIDKFVADSREYRFDNHFAWDLDGDQRVELGFNWRKQDLASSWNQVSAIDDPDNFRALNTQVTERLDFFALYEVNLTNELSLQVGGRYETADYDALSPSEARLFLFGSPSVFEFDPAVFGPDSLSSLAAKVSGFNPSIHLKWSFADDKDLRVSVAQTVRRPHLDELDPQVKLRYLNRPQVNNPSVVFGDPDLANEVALGLDIGYDWHFDGGVLGVNLYRRDIEDRIVLRRRSLDNLMQIHPAAAAEVDRFFMFLDADDSLFGGSDSAQILASANSDNTTKAQGVEVDLSVPVRFISENANIYFNATYATQKSTGESSERSTAINISYDHLIESIGLTYGFSYNQITDFESSEFNAEFGEARAVTRELDPNLEVFVEQKFNSGLVARLSVENVLDAKENVTTTAAREAVGYFLDTNTLIDTSPRVVLTFRGTL